LFDEKDLAEITDEEHFPGERLIVCRNPLLADERARKREELLKATEKDLDKIVAATQRTRKPLQGEDAIGLAVGEVIGDHKMKKHFDLTLRPTSHVAISPADWFVFANSRHNAKQTDPPHRSIVSLP